MDSEEVRKSTAKLAEFPRARSLLSQLCMVDGELDTNSLELIRKLGEGIAESKKKFTALVNGLPVKEQLDVIQRSRKSKVHMPVAANIERKLTRLKQIEDNALIEDDAGGDGPSTIMDEEFQQVVDQSAAQGLNSKQTVTDQIQLGKKRCQDLRSLISMENSPSGYVPFIFNQRTAQWTQQASEFSTKILDTCQTGPSNTGIEAAESILYQDPVCVESRKNFVLAKKASERIVDLSSEFMALTAEVASKSALKDALSRLNKKTMSWEEFSARGKPDSSASEIPELKKNYMALCQERGVAERKTLEKTVEKGISQILLSHIGALTKGYHQLAELTIRAKKWLDFLRKDDLLLEDFLSVLSVMNDKMKDHTQLLTTGINGIESVSGSWDASTMQQAHELEKKVEETDERIMLMLNNRAWVHLDTVNALTNQLKNLTGLRKIIAGFQGHAAVRSRNTALTEMLIALERAKSVMEMPQQELAGSPENVAISDSLTSSTLLSPDIQPVILAESSDSPIDVPEEPVAEVARSSKNNLPDDLTDGMLQTGKVQLEHQHCSNSFDEFDDSLNEPSVVALDFDCESSSPNGYNNISECLPKSMENANEESQVNLNDTVDLHFDSTEESFTTGESYEDYLDRFTARIDQFKRH